MRIITSVKTSKDLKSLLATAWLETTSAKEREQKEVAGWQKGAIQALFYVGSLTVTYKGLFGYECPNGAVLDCVRITFIDWGMTSPLAAKRIFEFRVREK